MANSSPPNMRGVAITSLPTEILSEVCSLLCLHCQMDNAVEASAGIVTPAYEDQKALARLSQCSKRLRDIAQQILFHWFHNLEGGDHLQPIRRLASFLRGIIRNPDLAAAVKAQAFYKHGWPWNLPHEEHSARRARDEDGVFRQAVSAIGGHLAERPWTEHPQLEDVQELAMALSPSLSQLCLQHIYKWIEAPGQWADWSYDMPNLTFLAFPGRRANGVFEDTYYIHQAVSLLRHAPRLRTLIAPDCAGGGEIKIWRFGVEPWDVSLPRLKRLSLNGSGLRQLGKLLRGCPALEDLEYFGETELGLQEQESLLNPETHLGHLRGTLRRVCYSVIATKPIRSSETSAQDTSGIEAPDDQDRDIQRVLDLARIHLGDLGQINWGDLSFSSFPVLEQLELEQLLLYGPVLPTSHEPAENRNSQPTTPDGFLAKLPPSLRRLRVGYIIHWPVIYRDLPALARESCRVPRLEAVKLEVFSAPPEEEHRGLVETFRSACNVAVFVCYVARSPMSRGLLPARPGHPKLVAEPVLLGLVSSQATARG